MRKNRVGYAFVAAGVLVALAAGILMGQGASWNLAPNPGFEDGLKGWTQRGPAEFAVDTEVKFSGAASARITVPEGTKPFYQSLYFEIGDVAGGDRYRAQARVRARGTTGGSAYMAMEFLDAANQRVSIYHSEISPETGRERWDVLSVSGAVPETARVLRLLLVLHDNATAWFDDVRLELVERAAPPSPVLTATLQPKQVVSRGWLGFGAQGDLFFWSESNISKGITDEDRALVKGRILAMRPQVVRLLGDLNWWEQERGRITPDSEGMRSLCETLAIYKAAGTDVMITEWGYGLPGWCQATGRVPHPDQRLAFVRSWASLIKYLRSQRGFTNVRYMAIYNEPNGGGISFEDYADVYRALDRALREAGLRKDVLILGPDETGAFSWFERAVHELDDVIDVYDAHNYTSNTGEEFAEWVKPRVAILPLLQRPDAYGNTRKGLMICEFGMNRGMSTYATPENGKYYYGIFLADAAASAASLGVRGMMMWCLSDTWYGSHKMLWGLWRYKDEGWEPRPGFYAWSLITRHTRRASSVHAIRLEGGAASAAAFRAPDGHWTLLIVNRARMERRLTIRGLEPSSRWAPYLYSEATVPTPDRGLIKPGPILTVTSKGELTYAMPPESFLLLTDRLGK